MKKIILLIISFLSILSLSSCNETPTTNESFNLIYYYIDQIHINSNYCEFLIEGDNSVKKDTYLINYDGKIEIEQDYSKKSINISSKSSKLKLTIFTSSNNILEKLTIISKSGYNSLKNCTINDISIKSKALDYLNLDNLTSNSINFNIEFCNHFIVNNSLIFNFFAEFNTTFATNIFNSYLTDFTIRQINGNININNITYESGLIYNEVGLINITLFKDGNYSIIINSFLKKINPELFTIQDNKYIHGDGSATLDITDNYNYVEIKLI